MNLPSGLKNEEVLQVPLVILSISALSKVKVQQEGQMMREHLSKLIESLTAPFAADLCFYLKKWIIADFCLTFNFKRVLFATTGHKIAT